MARYVPKTYNNRRGLRIIVGVFATLALSVVIVFFILFFYLQGYVVDGQLVHPLLDDWDDAPPPVSDDVSDEYDDEYSDSYDDGYEYDYESGYEYDDSYGNGYGNGYEHDEPGEYFDEVEEYEEYTGEDGESEAELEE